MNNLLKRAKSKKMRNRKGFTLIELIVVIVIIGILAAIVIPRLTGFQDRAKIGADVATAKTIATAAMVAVSDTTIDPVGSDIQVSDLLDPALYGLLPSDMPTVSQTNEGAWVIVWSDEDVSSIHDGTDAFFPEYAAAGAPAAAAN